MAARVFLELSARLSPPFSRELPIRPSVTIQTPQGLESRAWINQIEQGEKYLHGEQD